MRSSLRAAYLPPGTNALVVCDPMRGSGSFGQVKVVLYVAGIWLPISVGISSLFVRSEVERIKEEFSLQSEATFGVVRQRLDEDDAVFAGIDVVRTPAGAPQAFQS
jgi:hypothetical protein